MGLVKLQDATGKEVSIEYSQIQELPEHLEEISTAERIALVKEDEARRRGQLGIAITLIVASLAIIGGYLYFSKDMEFFKFMAYGMVALVIAAIGSSYNIFGLGGRVVGRKTQ